MYVVQRCKLLSGDQATSWLETKGASQPLERMSCEGELVEMLWSNAWLRMKAGAIVNAGTEAKALVTDYCMQQRKREDVLGLCVV